METTTIAVDKRRC